MKRPEDPFQRICEGPLPLAKSGMLLKYDNIYYGPKRNHHTETVSPQIFLCYISIKIQFCVHFQQNKKVQDCDRKKLFRLVGSFNHQKLIRNVPSRILEND